MKLAKRRVLIILVEQKILKFEKVTKIGQKFDFDILLKELFRFLTLYGPGK